MGDLNSTRFSAFYSYVLSLFTVICLILRRLLLRILAVGPIPMHIAIIMDGNRRFADRSGMERIRGHVFGYDSLINTLENCLQLGVKYVSVYAFSIENFARPQEEVDSLMTLMEEKFDELVKEHSLLNEYQVRVQVLGDLSLLPENVRAAAERAMAATQDHETLVLNLFVAYTSTAEIAHSIQEVKDRVLMTGHEETLCTRVCLSGERDGNNSIKRKSVNVIKQQSELRRNGIVFHDRDNGDTRKSLDDFELEMWGKRIADTAWLPDPGSDYSPSTGIACPCLDELGSCRRGSGVSEPWAMPSSITVKDIERHLYTAGCPPPDILIRTSGETRLSNFMLWQCCSNSRLAFCEVLWPDFSLRHLAWIILDYQRGFPALHKQRIWEDQMLDGRDYEL